MRTSYHAYYGVGLLLTLPLGYLVTRSFQKRQRLGRPILVHFINDAVLLTHRGADVLDLAWRDRRRWCVSRMSRIPWRTETHRLVIEAETRSSPPGWPGRRQLTSASGPSTARTISAIVMVSAGRDKPPAATRPAATVDQPDPAQVTEDVQQEAQRDLLGVRDGMRSHRARRVG